MSHHLAEVMDRAENESNLQKKEEYQKEVVELILKVWKHRTSLQADAYPLARFRGIIDSLSILSPEANVWERNRLNKYESLAADSFSMLVDLYRTLHFIEFVSLKSIKDKKIPPSVLSDEEQEIYNFLISWAEEELNFRLSSSDEFPSDRLDAEQASNSVCEFIDKLCDNLKELKNELKISK
ncbi:hypothetical protein [Microbulbifer sp. VAAF005]|uniref:hypothetical protein n=1 Tax=Microbulbifer sp. VAAF005 TaxID=3034230 RepID=UPI0024AD9404|nr:hypothetical protein [Microbulbifer sp. VAAF005]WHI47213.1 hypothetical protein P0078_02220 [Microbulbifer sp. VAAF005]